MTDWISTLHLPELFRYSRFTFFLFTPIFVLIVLAEKKGGADSGRYASRNFLNDFIYLAFYQVPYTVFILAPIMALVKPHVGVFLPRLPLPVSIVLYLLIVDFGFYWLHRVQHALPWLWAFHSVHHAQQRMTFLTTYRFHLLDQSLGVVNLVVISLLVGAPSGSFLPIVIAHHLFESAQHAELNWNYGKLYRVLVSPVFHAAHHATEPALYNKNFGKILSLWDFLFHTAATLRARPAVFGIDQLVIPESLVQQTLAPFKLLRARAKAASTAALAAKVSA
jgi:sterol desaturase/sphingolipid hydroxylase (fatty acid hydroxylase superfamily)